MDIAKEIKLAGKVSGMILGASILLALIVHTAFDIYVRVEFKKEVQRLREQGEPVTFGDFSGEVISDEENAASIYRKIFPTIDTYGDEWERVQRVSCFYTDSAEWTEEQKEDISYILSRHEDILDSVREASLRPYCDFRIDYDNAELDSFSLLRFTTLSHLLSTESALDKEEGRMEEAVGHIPEGFAVAEALGSTGSLLNSTVSMACERIMLNRLETLLTDVEISQQGYQKLYESIKKHRETSPDLVTGLQVEVCSNIISFKRPSEFLHTPGKYITRWPFATLVRLEHLRELRELKNAVQMAKRPYWEIADKNTGTYRVFLLKGAERDARLIAAELAVAINIYKGRNGDYPETLDELVPDIVEELPPDPFTGMSFAYKRQGNRFTVYSLGKNAMDDDGEWKQSGDDIAWESGGSAEALLTTIVCGLRSVI